MVSLLRILLVPVIVMLVLAGGTGMRVAAAGVFLAGALSDGLDGYLARRHGSGTRTGQWLDPLADKALVSAPIVVLTGLGEFPLWAAVVIVAREVGIAILRVIVGMRGSAMPASMLAKWKTVIQLAAITLYLLPLGAGADGVRRGVLIVAVALTVSTGVDYVLRAFGVIGRRAPVRGPAAGSGAVRGGGS